MKSNQSIIATNRANLNPLGVLILGALFLGNGMILQAKDIFDELKYFSKSEFRNPDQMDPDFLLKLDNFRGFVGLPIKIKADFAITGHSDNSQHYKTPCKAVDISIQGLTLFDSFFLAMKFGFSAIGVYFDWAEPGLHLDDRKTPRNIHWVRDEGKYIYKMTPELITRMGKL